MDKNSPAAELERFLNFVDACSQEYKNAYEKVNEEDRRVQDFLHQMEFAKDQAERNRVATKLQKSRRSRRQNKDLVKRNEKVVLFFLEEKNRGALNRMRQLLGQQRKEEEYLSGERIYKPRVKEPE